MLRRSGFNMEGLPTVVAGQPVLWESSRAVREPLRRRAFMMIPPLVATVFFACFAVWVSSAIIILQVVGIMLPTLIKAVRDFWRASGRVTFLLEAEIAKQVKIVWQLRFSSPDPNRWFLGEPRIPKSAIPKYSSSINYPQSEIAEALGAFIDPLEAVLASKELEGMFLEAWRPSFRLRSLVHSVSETQES